jgi:hypothetical protein
MLMIFPELFDKSDIRVTVALITGITALATTLLTLISSLFGTPLKYWIEKRALRNRLAVEYEYEQRKNLRELIVRHQDRMLESAIHRGRSTGE